MSTERDIHCAMVKLAVDNGVDINAVDDNGETLLHLATRKKCERCVQAVLQHNPKVNFQNVDGEAALHIAGRSKCVEVLSMILEHPEVQVDLRDIDGYNVLHCAANRGRLSATRLIIEKVPHIVDSLTDDEYKHSALHLAALKGYGEVAKCLVTEGNADKALTCSLTGRTALIMGIRKRHGELVKTLLDLNYDPKISDDQGNSAIHHVSMHADDSPEIINLILNHPNVDYCQRNNLGQTFIHVAAEFGNRAVIRALLTKNPLLVDIKDNEDYRPLHFASRKGHTAVAKILIKECKATVDSLNKHKLTPLMSAASFKRAAMIECLIGAGASLKSIDEFGNSVLHYIFKELEVANESLVIDLSGAPRIDEMYKKMKETSFFSTVSSSAEPAVKKCRTEGSEIEEKKIAIAAYCVVRGAPLIQANKEGQTLATIIGEDMTHRLIEFLTSHHHRRSSSLDSLEDALLCKICYDEPMSKVFPCGHSACAACAHLIYTKPCHTCKRIVDELRPLYL